MKFTRLLLAIGSLGLLGLTVSSPVRADSFDKKTTFTIQEPVQIPNAVLQPGTYVVKLLSSPSDRHIVQFYNEDQTQLITTVLAIPDYRLKITDKTQFIFWETPPGQPKALRAWFWPADNYGQEFAYPKTEAVQIAAAAKVEVPSTEAKAEPELKSAEVVEVTPQGKEEPVPEVAKSPVEVAQAAPPAPKAIVEELPATASPYPLIGLVGLILLAVFGVVRSVRTS